MRYLMVQPAINRFKWELQVQLTNLIDLGVEPEDIVLLFATNDNDKGIDNSIPSYFAEKYGVEVHSYQDERKNKQYIPSIKPYLWMKFLQEDASRETGTYFYMDADVIFREIPNLDGLGASESVWLCSDTDSYLSPKYIQSKGEQLFKDMQNIVGVDVSDYDGKSGGAQWVIVNPKAEYWQKVYEDCSKLYNHMNGEERKLIAGNGPGYVPIQKWTAEMWAQLWNMRLFGAEPKIVKELDFCMAPDDISRWYETKIYHNAGATEANKDLFFKGKWVNNGPFWSDHSRVSKDKCSYKYVEAIKKASSSL